ncbi:MAG: Fur family transcriptional regulator [Dehalococcoidia bacterium]|nr:Fur family transcriptional regulator [Dehalococcoidia bacterium]
MIRNTVPDSFARLQARGYKLTGPRRRIIEKLYDQRRAFTALELHQLLTGEGVSLASVYRTIGLLVEIGLAETATRSGDEQRYIACSPGQHHHHVVCSRCGQVADITDCLLEPFEDLVRERTNFTIESHTLEFHGYCAACRQ